MNFNVEENLSAVDRSVSSLERDGQPAHAVILSRGYPTTLDDLWDAATNADRIPHWFLPISGNLELGGSYQLEGNAGGRITACQPPSHYAITWEFGGFVTWVNVDVSDDGSGHARFTITHTAHHSEQWDTYGPGATGVGFEMGLLGLAMHLTDPDQPKPDPTGIRHVVRRQGLAYRQQPGLGRSSCSRRNRPRPRPSGRRAHHRFLHRRRDLCRLTCGHHSARDR